LGRRQLGFLFIRETQGPGALLSSLKREFGGICIANDGYDIDSATSALKKGEADAVAFGRAYIANPDLVARLQCGATLNEVNSETIYDLVESGARGYTDYPLLDGVAAA
jgi:2,4-dienoyl-CoA reductase-like NADH-dependent reductase (Old Yellow Enzyme family)